MATSIGAAGDRIEVLSGILSGIESKSSDLLVPRLLTPTPIVAAEGKVKTLDGGHMDDGGSVDAFKNAPGSRIVQTTPLKFGSVQYACEYRRLFDLVPKEAQRADIELPMSEVELRSRVMMGRLLRNRDLALVNALETTSWGIVNDLSAGGGANQWSADGSDPIDYLAGVVDDMPMGAGVAVFGSKSWREFKTHPKVLSALSINRDSAILNSPEFMEVIGERLGLSQLIVYRLQVVTNGKPLASVAVSDLVRRFSDKVWLGTLNRNPGTPQTDARGRHEVVVEPTALGYFVEDELEYEEEKSINPMGRQMTVGMSYDIRPVTAALGCRLDNVVA
jgi:hypothetical protein